MPMFRKRPVEVEAKLWRRMGDHPMVFPLSRWPQLALPGTCNCGQPAEGHGAIPALEGVHVVCPGDWIITGVAGEHYPCKPDIFAGTYERVA